MGLTYVVHIVAGGLGIISGFIALYVTKGAKVHRRAGMVFFYSMFTMAVVGMSIAMLRGVAPAINVPAGMLTAYLVVTGLTTVRPVPIGSRSLQLIALIVALGVGFTSISFGLEAVANGGMRKDMPPYPFFMFGIVALLGCVGDVRQMRSGALRGAQRLARHLWRMSFALFIAALSFFIGQADVFPKPIRIMPVLALPVLAVLTTMFYWLWRVRIKRSLPVGISTVSSANILIPREKLS